MNVRRHSAASHQSGFVLLPVILMITLVASVIFLLTRENASSLSVGASEAEKTEALYIASAGAQHALARARQANCSNYSSITNEPFGDHSYSVVVTPTGGSPVTFQSTAALASGASTTIQRSATTVYSAASTQLVTLQPGAEGDDAEIWQQGANNNYGDSAETWVSSASNDTTRSLLRFDIAAIPAGAIVLKATLSLLRQSGSGVNEPVSAHRIRNQWSEASVTWNSRESGTNWDTAGGDFDNAAIATTPVGPGNSPYEWNIEPLVQGWIDGSYPNYGVALVAAISGMSGHRFYTGDEVGSGRHPSLSVTYACECGVVCALPGTLPIAHWQLDDASGVNALDSVGGNDGTLINGPSWTAGSTNGGLSFDELDDFVRVPDMSYGPDFSVSFDINVADNSGSLFQYMFSHGNINDTNSLNIFLVEGSHGTDPDVLRTVIRDADDTLDNSALEFDASAIVGDGNWHTYTLTVENGVGAKVYLDGALQNSDSRGGGPFDPNGDLFFGARQDLDPNRLYGGLLDEVRIYNTALDATEVADLAAGPGTVITSETRVADTDDDAEQRTGDGYMDLSSSDLELAFDIDGSQTNLAGMRFVGVAVPQGATISNAYIQFQVDEVRSGDAKLSIIGQDIDSAEKFMTADFDISDRARTTASVPWAAPPWNTVGEAGPDQQTPNIASVIQEIVNRPGWSSDNALVLMILGSGTRTAESYDGDPNGAPLLHIEYSGGGDSAPAVDVLFVVGDPGNLTTRDAGRKSLMDGWGYTVSLIDDNDSALTFDSAIASVDAVYMGTSSSASAVAGKVEDQAIGIVNENTLMLDNFGFSLGVQFATHDQLEIIDASHYIMSDYAGTPVTILSGPGSLTALSSSVAPDLLSLAGAPVSGPDPIIVAALDVGATDVNSRVAAGRRVNLPLTQAETSAFTADGEKLMRRAIEWAAGTDIGGGGGGCIETVGDDFDSGSYDGNTGSLNWTTSWEEFNDTGGASSGDERVQNDGGETALRVRDNDGGGEGVEREVNLSGYVSAELSLNFRRHNLDNSDDYVAIELSPDGGINWNELGRFEGPGSDDVYDEDGFGIDSYLSANTRIRLITSSTMGGTDAVFFDNIEICVTE